jgi:hypothetical protein
MRVSVIGLVLASLILQPRFARADGGEGGSGPGDGDSGTEPVIACDGDLCDTVQGRPSCTVASHTVAAGALDVGWLGCAAVAAVVCFARRAKRGA